MDRGAWQATVHGDAKELHMTEQLTNTSNIQFSRSVVSDSLQPHGLQHTRPPCHHQLLELTQTHVHCGSDAIQPSHPLSFSSRLQSFPASGLF